MRNRGIKEVNFLRQYNNTSIANTELPSIVRKFRDKWNKAEIGGKQNPHSDKNKKNKKKKSKKKKKSNEESEEELRDYWLSPSFGYFQFAVQMKCGACVAEKKSSKRSNKSRLLPCSATPKVKIVQLDSYSAGLDSFGSVEHPNILNDAMLKLDQKNNSFFSLSHIQHFFRCII